MRVSNLIKSDIRRLKKDKPLKVIVILTLLLNIFNMGVYKLLVVLLDYFPAEGMEAVEAMGVSSLASMAVFSCLSLQNVGLLIAVAVAMFIGKDYSYNTIRHKICSGASRTKVYLSTLAVALMTGLAIHIMSIAENILLSVILGFESDMLKMLYASLISLPLYVGFIAVMVMISNLLKSSTLGLVINVVIVIFVPSILSLFSISSVEVLNEIVSVIPYAVINDLTMGTVNAAVAVKGCVGGTLLAVIATIGGIALYQKAEF